MLHAYNIYVHAAIENFANIFLTHITQRVGITRHAHSR